MQLDLWVKNDSAVAESPFWDQRSGRACWIEMLSGTLMSVDSSESRTRTSHSYEQLQLMTSLGAVVPVREQARDQAGFVAAAGRSLVHLNTANAANAVTSETVVLPDGQRFNDAKCDRAGRLWVGSCGLGHEPSCGQFWSWDGNRVLAHWDELTLPNGIGWSPDDRWLYLADSGLRCVFRARFDVDIPAVGPPERFVDLSAEPGVPDGLAVDTDGCLWLAMWGGSGLLRIKPDGQIIGRVTAPVSQPSSCAFISDSELMVTSARASLSEESLATEPLAGSLFVVDSNIGGLPVGAFGPFNGED